MNGVSVWQILGGTPWWVWVLLAYLIKIGIKASHTRVVSIYRLAITPLIFVVLTIHAISEIPMDWVNILCLILSLLIGISLGFWQISRLALQVDKTKKLMRVPGSWTTLILIVIIFISKFYFGAMQALNPDIVYSWTFALPALAISAICSGLFIGRIACYICRFKSLPHQDLARG